MYFEPGTLIGAYRIEGTIGRGAMGTVYRAHHPELNRTVAIKVLDGVSARVASEGRFRREGVAIAQMRHPNVLTVHDFGQSHDHLYMVLEYAAGGSLADRVTLGEAVPVDEALTLLRGIAAGIDHAHSLGIVHRDIKPQNVLIAGDGTPMLADFGLVKLLEGPWTMTTDNTTSGTPAYMAPEQVSGNAGAPADRYSFATIAYQLLTGHVPFQGHVMEMLYAQVNQQPPPPSEYVPALGPNVDAVLLRGLAKNPDERWESCSSLLDALERALRGEQVEALPAGPAAKSDELEPAPSGSRRWWPAAALALLGCALVAVLALSALLHGDGRLQLGYVPSNTSTSTSASESQAGTSSTGSTSGTHSSPSQHPSASSTSAGSSGSSATPAGGGGSGGTSSGATPTPTPSRSGGTPTPSTSPTPTPTQTPTPTPSTGGNATVPAAPLAVTGVGGLGRATVSWTAPANGGSAILWYTVDASNGGGTWRVSGSRTSITVALPGGTYSFRVRATNSVGTGSWSTVSTPVVVL